MATWTERAFDMVTEITKQVLTLSAAIITVSITFVKDFALNAPPAAKQTLAWSWAGYTAAIFFGVLTLMISAAHQAAGDTTPPTINARNIRIFGGLQLLAFFTGIVLTVTAGAKAI